MRVRKKEEPEEWEDEDERGLSELSPCSLFIRSHCRLAINRALAHNLLQAICCRAHRSLFACWT